MEMRHQQQAGDQKQVQQDRGRGRRGEAVDGIKKAALQCRQRDEQEIGEGDAGQRDDQVELAGLGAETGGDDRHQPGHENFAEQHKSEQHRKQHREGFLGKDAHGRLAALGQRARGERHKGGVERPLGKQAAKQIWEALRHKEGVGDRPGAEDRRGQNIADKAEHPAYQRIGADRRDRAKQSH